MITGLWDGLKAVPYEAVAGGPSPAALLKAGAELNPDAGGPAARAQAVGIAVGVVVIVVPAVPGEPVAGAAGQAHVSRQTDEPVDLGLEDVEVLVHPDRLQAGTPAVVVDLNGLGRLSLAPADQHLPAEAEGLA